MLIYARKRLLHATVAGFNPLLHATVAGFKLQLHAAPSKNVFFFLVVYTIVFVANIF